MKDERKTKKQLIEELEELRAKVPQLESTEGGERKAEAELREALLKVKFEKNRGDSIVAAMGAGVIIQDTDYRIVYQNDLNKDLFGNRTGELCYRVYEGIDRICDHCPVELTYRDGQIHRSMRSVSTPKGGRHYELTSSPLKDPSGAIVAGIKVVHDVTERVEAEQQLGFGEVLLRSPHQLPAGHLLPSRQQRAAEALEPEP